jgi:hypothetical protein
MIDSTEGTGTLVRADPAVLGWLRDEFPDWDVRIERTAALDGSHRALWIAAREGHHPQSALSAAKLHTRMADYLDRESRRMAARN